MTLTVAAGSEEEVTEKAVALASESHPGMRVAETIARGVLDDRG
jgi:hypothetical protein